MHLIRKRKLIRLFWIALILTITCSLVLYALRQNISLFYSPTQVKKGEAPLHLSIRVGGMVEKGSLVRQKDGLQVQFKLSDLSNTLTIHYKGILPDLFREGQGIVAEGKLIDQTHFEAREVLAKHDANYMPPQVSAALALQRSEK